MDESSERTSQRSCRSKAGYPTDKVEKIFFLMLQREIKCPVLSGICLSTLFFVSPEHSWGEGRREEEGRGEKKEKKNRSLASKSAAGKILGVHGK